MVFEQFLFQDINRILLRQARYLDTFKSVLEIIDTQLETVEEKAIYWKILASQLTVHELKYIFFQSLADIDGDFSKLVDRSKILEERSHDIGVSKYVKLVYLRLHGKDLTQSNNKIKEPHNRKDIKKLKKQIDKREKHSKSSKQNTADGASS